MTPEPREGVRSPVIWTGVASITIITIGCLVLVGWMFNIPLFMSVLPDLVSMKANTAFGFILVGIGLWILRRETITRSQRFVVQACALVVLLVSLLSLGEYIFSWDLGIDQLIVRDVAQQTAGSIPRLMAEITAFCFILLGLALLFLKKPAHAKYAQIIALIVFGIGVLALAGYAYGVPALYGVFGYSPVPLYTAITLVFAGAGILLARPNLGLMTVIMADHPGGHMIRRLIPAAIFVPLIVGWLWQKGQQSELYGSEFRLALFALSTMAIFIVLVWWNAHSLKTSDDERKQADKQIRKLNRTLAVLSDVNQAIVRIHHMPTFFDEVCKIAVEKGEFRMAWIGLLDKETKRVNPVAHAGVEEDFLEKLKIMITENPQGLGPSSEALRTGRHVICNDVEHDPQMLPWLDHALRFGYRSFIALPLIVSGNVVGNFTLFANEVEFFIDEELKLVDEMAMDISFAMTVAEQESQRVQAEVTVKRYAQRLEILHEIDTGIIKANSTKAIAEAALQHILDLIPCQHASITLIDDATHEWVFYVVDSDSPTKISQDTRIPIEPDVINTLSTEPIKVIDDFELMPEPDPTTKLMLNDGMRTSIHARIVTQGRALGSLNLLADTPYFFTDEYQAIAVEVANQLAIAIRQMNLSEQLHQSEGRYRKVVEDQTDLICRYQPDFTLTFVNRAYSEFYQKTPDEMIGLNIFDLMSDEDRTMSEVYITQLSASTPSAASEHRSVLPDGSVRWIQWKDRAILDDKGNITEYQGVGRDITERKLAEESVLKQQKFAEAQRDSLAALTTSLDVDTVMTQILDQAAHVVPYDSASIIHFKDDFGQVIYSQGFSPEAQAFFKTYRYSLKESRFSDMILQSMPYLVTDTRSIPDWIQMPTTEWIRSSIGVPIIMHGGVLGILTMDSATPNRYTSVDVERLQVFARYAALALENAFHTATLENKVDDRTAELTIAKSRVEAILNNSTDGILLAHMNSGIQQSNSTFNTLFACEADAYFGKPLTILVNDADQELFAKTFQSVVTKRQGKCIEVHARRHDNTLFDAELGVGYVQTDDQDEVSFVCTIRDITERKNQERQLRFNASVQESMSDAVIVTDTELRIRGWNKAAERIYGWKSEEVIGRLGQEVLQTQFISNVMRADVLRDLNEQGYWSGEVTHQHKDGSTIHILSSTVLLKDEFGSPSGIGAVNHNITERIKAERVLQAKHDEERKFQKYLQILHDMSIELTQIDDLDLFYKQVVEFGLNRLDFDRMAMFLYDPVRKMASGTYGTDTEGHLQPEHHFQFLPQEWGGLWNSMQTPTRFYLDEDATLSHELKSVGAGWNASVALWYGNQNLGWIVADNLINHEPISQPQLDILGQYGMYIAATMARKQTETALRESETRYRLLAENISDVIASTNGLGECVYISPSSQLTLGYEPAELIGQNMMNFIHPDDQEEMWDGYRLAIENNSPAMVSTSRFRHKDGHYLWLESVARPIYSGEKGEIQGFVTSSRDVTERKRLVEELDEQRIFLRNVIDVSPNLIFVKDYDSRFVLVNQTVANLYNTTVEGLIGKTDADVNRSPGEVENFLTADRQVITSGEPLNLEEPLTNRNGETRWLQTTKIRIVSADGQSIYVLGVSTDITERKNAEESLRKAYEREKELGELKSRFVSMASHEFRTPLASILALTETLTVYRHRLDDTQIEQRLGKIKYQVGHLTDIIDDVLHLVRMQARRVEFNPMPVDVDLLCRSVIDDYQSRPNMKHQFQYNREGVEVRNMRVDEKLIRKVIDNLLSNAVKYSPDGKLIIVNLKFDDIAFIISISDEGIGVPEADLKHLFELFHRADNVGAISGTGLGLAITKEAIEMHGGTIAVESKIGSGTTFTVTIPARTEEGK